MIWDDKGIETPDSAGYRELAFGSYNEFLVQDADGTKSGIPGKAYTSLQKADYTTEAGSGGKADGMQ
jgi:hypothetical protein